jgi:hypothetical protein
MLPEAPKKTINNIYPRSMKKETKTLLRKHGGDLLLGQNDILHGILLALQILRFVVCV